jgi:deoxycytidylate deaminase
MNNNFPSIFRLARNIAKMSQHPKHKLGAVLVVKGTPLSVGHNQRKSHPEAFYTGLHAEIQALKNSGKKEIKGSTMFVYRNRKDGTLAMAKPCVNCMEELKKFGIKRVWYTTSEYPYFETIKF